MYKRRTKDVQSTTKKIIDMEIEEYVLRVNAIKKPKMCTSVTVVHQSWKDWVICITVLDFHYTQMYNCIQCIID